MQYLFKIALISAILGTILLIFLSNTLEPKLIEIKDIDAQKINSFVKVSGNITNIKDVENMLIINITDKSGSIKVILYRGDEIISLNKGMQIVVAGRIIEYKSQLEIEANSVKIH